MIFRNELDFKEPQKKLNQLILILDIKFKKFNYNHIVIIKII